MTQWLSQCGRADLRCGDSLQVMPTLAPDSVDAIVTDPPYGLTFMGKEWDRGVPGVEFWREAYRVAKPGAHLLAFGGTRTYHRQTCAIEDAGWEIRDCIMWVYGSGFPKSLDVSKAIDKCDGQPDRLHRFTAWMRSTGLKARQLDQITDTNMGGHYLTDASQPAIPTAALWELIRPHCGDVPAWVDELVQRIEAEREVLGQKEMTDTTKARAGFSGSTHSPDYDGSKRLVSITAPATDAARKWSGWGTALKPAVEPIVLARKPLQGTVAANVLRHGTGAINVDGCRIPNLTGQRPDDTLIAWEQEKNLCDLCARRAESPAKPVTPATRDTSAGSHAEPTTSAKGVSDRANTGKEITGCSAGLFRAEQASDQTEDSNLSIEESGRMPTAQSRQATKYTTSTETDSTTNLRTCSACGCSITALHTKGSMPPSKNATPNTPAAQGIAVPSGRWPSNLIHDGSDEVVDGFPQDGESSAARFFYCAKADGEDRDHGNTHPTVKPNDLMRYLIKLIAPKDALILDPFMGSGSTGVAAIQMHNRFIGIELGEDHFEICKRRVAAAFDTFPLLNPKGNQ